MKFTKSQLKQIIKEELEAVWNEADANIQKSWDKLYHIWRQMQDRPKTKNKDSFIEASTLVRGLMLHIENSPGDQDQDRKFMEIARRAIEPGGGVFWLLPGEEAEDTFIELIDQSMGAMEHALREAGRIAERIK
jgi:hypothetical protein